MILTNTPLHYLFATCHSSAAAQNVLQLDEVLNECESLLHKALCVHIPHRRHGQLDPNITLTHSVWIRSAIPTMNTTQVGNILLSPFLSSCLQCFDAVGWAAGRAYSL